MKKTFTVFRSLHFFYSSFFLILTLLLSNCNSSSQFPLVAVGQNANLSAPLIVNSLDGGFSWNLQNLSVTGFFTNVNCSGLSSKALCIAGGENGTTSYEAPPLVALSNNGGSSWEISSYFQNLPNALIGTSSCTGSGSTAICVAGGQNATNAAFLAVSTDGGNNWTQPANSLFTAQGIFYDSVCMGSGSTAICIAVGQDYEDIAPPFMVISTNGGVSWSVVSGFSNLNSGYFSTISCIGSGSSATCVSVGQNGSSSLIAVSQNAGNSWALISDLPNGLLNGVSCTGGGSNGVCVAVGQKEDNSPLIAVSSNSGNSWSVSSVPNLTTQGIFYNVSCYETGINTTCVTVGQDLTGAQPPLLVVSNDGGNNWIPQTVSGFPATGTLDSVSCNSVNGYDLICITAGYEGDYLTGPPLLALTIDNGSNWQIPTISGFPSLGALGGTSASIP